ncbi:MAG: extracellular solute-binding protein [Clostridia bacterium]|nr:extracellular solute-binding protein [Clostridia bacterium]
MKIYAKVISLLCALLMILSCFAACADTAEGETTTEGGASTSGNVEPSVTTDPNYDEDGYLKSKLPEDLKYTGETISILNWKAERPEFEILESEIGLDLVQDKIYERNIAAEGRLGITFEWTEKDGNSNTLSDFVNHVQNCYESGDYYDIIATYSRTAASLSAKGLLEDLNRIENSYLDLSMPWWPETMLETCSMKDSLFFVSGDISTNLLHMMYAIYYNIDMLENLNLEDPVKMVDNKTWTIDALIEMTADLYQDADNSTKPSDDDIFGFTSNYFHLEAFYSGSGMKLLEPGDGNNVLAISEDYTSTKAVDLVDKLRAWFEQGDTYINPPGGSLANDTVFADGRALFTQNRVYIADTQYNKGMLRNAEWEYGILPNPLYDKSQEDYITLLGNPFTLWCIMSGARNPSMSSAVIECLASEGYRKTSPALFENNMKYRYTPDSSNKGDGARMFDIIRDNISFDLGRMFAAELDYISEKPLRAALNNQSWASTGKQIKGGLNKRLKSLNDSLASAFD